MPATLTTNPGLPEVSAYQYCALDGMGLVNVFIAQVDPGQAGRISMQGRGM